MAIADEETMTRVYYDDLFTWDVIPVGRKYLLIKGQKIFTHAASNQIKAAVKVSIATFLMLSSHFR